MLNQMSYRRESTMISPWEMFRSQSLLGLGGLLESSWDPTYYFLYIAHGVAPDETPWSKHGLCLMLCNTWDGAVDEEIHYLIRNKGVGFSPIFFL